MFPPSAPTQLQMPQAPQQQPMMPNFFNRVNSAVTSNPMALSMAGLGILSGQGNRDAFSRGMQGFMGGMAMDNAEKERKEKRRHRNVTASYLVKQGLAPDQETAEALVASGAWKDLVGSGTKPVTVAKGASLVDPQTGRVVYQGADNPDAPSGYRWSKEGSLEAIPGGPATRVPAEVAGRMSLAQTTLRDLSEAERAFKDVDTGDRIGMQFGAGEIGRAQRTVRQAIEAALRLMTGAAAPETEVARYEDLFMPKSYDRPETRDQKLRNLRAFVEEAIGTMSNGRAAPGEPSSVTNARPNDPLDIR